ncbi:MAG: hypothetical protein HY438_03970 [DPANN group archaeon]|nr:hypothetical protein [DPANN group archaeon]
MELEERIESRVINVPPWFGNSIRAKLTRFYYEITGQLETKAAHIPEDEAFGKAFAALSRKNKSIIVEWLRDNYCRVEGLDYRVIKL